MKHTILGAGGSVGNALAYELLNKNENVRLVSRSGFSIPNTEIIKADLNSYSETLKSIENSDIVYLTVGLPYNSKIWDENWMNIMKDTIDACKKVSAKLIFFDNVYMYGKVIGKMTEKTPYNPCSKKGEIRAKVATMLEDEMKKENINAVIARSADLYGPYANKTSLPFILVIDKLINGKKAQWMLSDTTKHSFTYTIDSAKAMILLANNKKSDNQIWHLPTYSPAITGKEFIELVAKELEVAPNYSVLKKWMVKLVGFFNNDASEAYEMLYQNEFEYNFNSDKFNNYFNYNPITYKEGIHETIKHLK